MSIKIIPEPVIYITEYQRRRFMEEYRNFTLMYCGIPPSFESFVRTQLERQVEES